jgi:flagellar biosynthesis/type III secretory pathway M-ring protein FliF/YscJ
LALLPPTVPDAVRSAMRWIAPRKLPVGGGAALIILLVAFGVAAPKLNPQTALFGAPLHPSQAMEVERSLLVWNEPFTTDAQHAQIFVSASRRQAILLRLTLAGLPHAYVPTTADVLAEQPNAFAPPSFFDDRRRAGIEGDLVAGLRRMAGVADATVVIAPAADDPLAGGENQSPASASVELLLQPQVSLTQEQINGVKHFVAASYPGLSADRVVVVDEGGTEAAPLAASSAIREQALLQSSIQSALDAVYGAGSTVVRVSMRRAGEERTSQRTLVTPHGVLEADRGSESGTESGKRFRKEHTQTRYAYDTTVETRSAHADALDRLSVAVFIDSEKVSPEQAQQVAQVVRAAAGADLQKDQVVVAAVPFNAQPHGGTVDDRRSLRALAPAGAIVAALVACWSAIGARRTARPTLEDRAAAELQASLRNEMPQTAAYVLGGLPLGMRERVLRAYAPEQREQIVGWMHARTPDA